MVATLICAFLGAKASGTGHGEEKEFSSDQMIMHHISDAHEWHFVSFGHTHIVLPLPVILIGDNGLEIFSSSKFHNDEHKYNNYILFHEKIYKANAAGGLDLDEHGHPTNAKPLDISITKNVASMLVAVTIMCLIFISVAKAYRKREGQAPSGLQNAMEPLIMFVRDEIARPNIGEKAYKYTPYLLTIFFFIWINNLLGLLPGAANVTGNIAVTALLSVLTLLITNFSGNKSYWGHILWPPGVPVPVKFILIPVEIIGILTKPFALMIRLFANITAGHIIILSIISLIFMFGKGGTNPGGGYGVSVLSVAFGVFLTSLELLVAALQAFIFTMLTALFIGQATEDHGHHDEEHHHAAAH